MSEIADSGAPKKGLDPHIHTFLNPDPDPFGTGEFGFAVAETGGNVLVGARANPGAGKAYLFDGGFIFISDSPVEFLVGSAWFWVFVGVILIGVVWLAIRRRTSGPSP